MALGVKLEPVAKLLDKEFFIRSYQRGYRWDQDHVKDLLNDLKEFIDRFGKTEDDFYCLQPIVVKQLSEIEREKLDNFHFDSPRVYEIIDGQQRITTITILLHYLLGVLKDDVVLSQLPIITYEVRPKSKEIISKFSEYMNCQEKAIEFADNIDFYHMKVVYEAISDWFTLSNIYVLPFLKLLTSYKVNPIKVIWYEVADSENSIDVFRRFNVGKISLTNAELIKALFLKNDETVPEAIKYSISKEWQHIENQLQADFFWSFLNPTKKYSSRIEYIFDLLFSSNRKFLSQQEKNAFDAEYGTDVHKVFRYFSSIIEKSNDLLGVWDNVNAVFEKFSQWFKYSEHYHYIGYLQNMEGNTKQENIVLDILSYQNPKTGTGFQTKSELTIYLNRKIHEKVKTFFKNYKIVLKYGDRSSSLRNLFFLFNVETCVKLSASSKGEEIYNLPFSLNKRISYDIEHIDSKNEKEIEGLKPLEKIGYLKDIDIDFGYEMREEFNYTVAPIFLNQDVKEKWEIDNIDQSKLNAVLTKVLTMLDELLERDSDKVKDKDVIGNLTLLNDTINRSYGNSYFNTKRRLIIENDKKGEYIPISTKNVFMKYYSGNIKKHTRWSEDDAYNYQSEIEMTLAKFL
jgi:uncharacterized protein with ParB-like and HNH nuclease domain